MIFLSLHIEVFFEHDCRGYTLKHAIAEGKKNGLEINMEELYPWKYPTDTEIESIGVRGLFISNFFFSGMQMNMER